MPTSSGKPRVGERVRVRAWNATDWSNATYATVVHRSDGLSWSLRVRTDDGQLHYIGEAGWLMEKGLLEVVKED